MTNNIILSIIIPFYKVPLDLLDNCLGSIYRHNCNLDVVEVILVNDGSPTSPEEVLSKPEYQRVKYIVQENKGLGGARNTGMLNATGDYLLFVDGDDYLVNGAIDSIINWISSNEKKVHPSDLLRFEYNIVSSLVCESSQNNTTTDIKTITVDSSYFETHNLSSHVWRNVIRRSFICDENYVLLFEERIFCEDELWTPQMILKVRNIDITAEKLYCYYSNPNSIMRNVETRERHNADWKIIVRKLNEIVKKHVNCPLFFRMRLRKVVLAHIHLLAYQQAEYNVLENYISFLKEEGLFPIKLYGNNENVTAQMHVFAVLCNFRMTRYLTFNYFRHKFKR